MSCRARARDPSRRQRQHRVRSGPPADTPTRRAFARVAKYAAAVAQYRLDQIARIPDVSRPPATAQKYLPRKPRNASRIHRAVLCMRSSAVLHGVPDPGPHVEYHNWVASHAGILDSNVFLFNDVVSVPPSDPVWTNFCNTILVNARRIDVTIDNVDADMGGPPGVNDGGFNNEDPPFDPKHWVVNPGDEAGEEYQVEDDEVYGDDEPYDEYELDWIPPTASLPLGTTRTSPICQADRIFYLAGEDDKGTGIGSWDNTAIATLIAGRKPVDMKFYILYDVDDITTLEGLEDCRSERSAKERAQSSDASSTQSQSG
ncbi:hypothetical protein AURDEDRAFT_184386 [Auricularia subglabra TFB-10046 SS5]|nr:hypothetical protein AURDEDRAFT_184386 [Auricularia subglabra TFB-10046 SS5]